MVRRLLALSILLLSFASCGADAGCGNAADGSSPCTRILFIGNSYTEVNNLPGMVAAMARAGGHRVETAAAVTGGASLADQLNSPETLKLLGGSKWNLVILQEQSQLPAIEQFRREQTFPAARQLAGLVRATGAEPMFFMTWARRDGWPENGLPTYESMQSQIAAGYLAIARELSAPVAPVGKAWLTVTRSEPGVVLWQADGSHPSMAGTYLAACVFYAAIFHQSPVLSTYVADLPASTAQILQAVAAQTVLTSPGQWNLP